VTDGLVGALDRLGNLIDILRLDDCLQVVLKYLGEVVYTELASFATTSQHDLLCSSDPRKYLRISSQSGGLSYLPKFGFNLPLRIFNAVLFPIPFVPTNPST
jgi:hypothetical protein